MRPTAHEHFLANDLKGFRELLKGLPPSGAPGGCKAEYGSLSKTGSWGSAGHHHPSVNVAAEVNRRDHLGRTPLHLVCSSTAPSSLDYLHVLLAVPALNPNLQDYESGWTALHRALYLGNLLAARLLLRHPGIDLKLKDAEGLTAFDLYNSTVEGTNPTRGRAGGGTELFTWGANRNFVLGTGDGDDRHLPERLSLRQEGGSGSSGSSRTAATEARLPTRFDAVGIVDISMAKLHSAVLTTESSGNVRLCGFGNNGRLGAVTSTQTHFAPIPSFPLAVCSIALGQDHTVIVTASGSAYSFGSNKFGQLGYPIEIGQGVTAPGSSGRMGNPALGDPRQMQEHEVQVSPRRIVGNLKKEHVIGAAASRIHSVVFTESSLYTFGTNTGQLGYDKNAHPVQMTPRKVTAISQAIVQVAVTEFATAVLLETAEVLVFHNDTHFRVAFPTNRFSPEWVLFRPQGAYRKPEICKITSSGTTFAALSNHGDVFTFSLEHPSEYSNRDGGATTVRAPIPKPQLVWSLRRKFTAVRDVALGLDGSIILCTESGHVFVRSRRAESSTIGIRGDGAGTKIRSHKFQKVPYLQRVVKVCANETGAFGAITADTSPPPISVHGPTLADDLQNLLPQFFISVSGHAEGSTDAQKVEDGHEDDISDTAEDQVDRYEHDASKIAAVVRHWDKLSATEESGVSQERALWGPHNLQPPHGSDMFVVASGRYVPAHRTILATRVPVLKQLLNSTSKASGKVAGLPGLMVKRTESGVTQLFLPNYSLASVLFLLHYLYTDDIPTIWTTSVGMRIESAFQAAKLNKGAIHKQLIELAQLLQLEKLARTLDLPAPSPPMPSLTEDFAQLFRACVATSGTSASTGSALHDVELCLADSVVRAHSTVLHRSPFFAAMFDDPDWTRARWREDGVIEIRMRHLSWKVMEVVLRHCYTDGSVEMFGDEAVDSVEEYIDFIFEVLAAANELLLDKLKLICCSLLRDRVNVLNVTAIMADADFYNAVELKQACMDFCARTMETLLESGLLDDMEHALLRDLMHFVWQRQRNRLPISRTGEIVNQLLAKHADYLADLDIPKPTLYYGPRKWRNMGGKSPKLSPLDAKLSMTKSPPLRPLATSSPVASPELKAIPDSGDIFEMDEDDGPRLRPSKVSSSPSPLDTPPLESSPAMSRAGSVWRSRTVEAEKADMRSIMAAEQARRPSSGMAPSLTPRAGSQNFSHSLEDSSSPWTVSIKLSQKDRKRQQQLQSQAQQSATPPSPGPATPWKMMGERRTSQVNFQRASEQASPSSSLPRNASADAGVRASPSYRSASEQGSGPCTPRVEHGFAAASGTSSTVPTRSSPAHATGPSQLQLGPTITPVRASKPPAQRRTSGATEPAWASSSALPGGSSAYPALPSASVSPAALSAATGLTFAEIQEQQQLELTLAREKGRKKTLAEIQEEERKQQEASKAKQEEEDFMLWWKQEEARVKKETEAAQRRGESSGGRGGKKGGRAGRQPLGEGRPGDGSTSPATSNAKGRKKGKGKAGDEVAPTEGRSVASPSAEDRSKGPRREGKGKGAGEAGVADEPQRGEHGKARQQASVPRSERGDRARDGNRMGGHALPMQNGSPLVTPPSSTPRSVAAHAATTSLRHTSLSATTPPFRSGLSATAPSFVPPSGAAQR